MGRLTRVSTDLPVLLLSMSIGDVFRLASDALTKHESHSAWTKTIASMQFSAPCQLWPVPQILQALPLPYMFLIINLLAAPTKLCSWMAVALPGRPNARVFDLIMLVALTKSACVSKFGTPFFPGRRFCTSHGTTVRVPISNDCILLDTIMLSSRVCNCKVRLCSKNLRYREGFI